MDKKKRSTIFGAALVIFGVLIGIRLGVYLLSDRPGEDGPLLRLPQGGINRPTRATAAPDPTVPAGPAEPEKLCFSQADAEKIALRYGDGCSYRPDTEALLWQELNWDLMADGPTVLIVHTHASESYTQLPGQDYAQTTQYRTLNTDYNMVALGEQLAQRLEAAGIRVVHDRSIHDYPSYNSAYNNSREAVQSYLQRYPSIQVVLDLHRDAVLNSDGSQYAPTVTVGGEEVARLMLVVGTDGSGMHHPHWQENLSAAIKLQVLLERQAPGITRPTILRAQRFNHDLSQGAMIVEIGTAGNTLQQAMGAVPILAQALIALCRGTTTDSAT
jgi:stage II sporulation protein P